MILSLALLALSSTPQPRITVETAGFLRDTRVLCSANNQLSLQTRIQSPALLARRDFVIEGLDAQGKVRFQHEARARGLAAVVRAPRWVDARIECELPKLDGIAEIRVRLAR